jgi:hypothetical protein
MKSSKQKSAKAEATIIPPEEKVLSRKLGRPVKPVRYEYQHGGRGYQLYRSIDWVEWWEDFATATDQAGKLIHKTAWAFIKRKTKNKKDRNLLYEMIGPRPEAEDGERLRCPWLGNWQRRRDESFWSLDNPGKMKQIQQAIRERKDGLEAARAIAPLSAENVGRFSRLLRRIDLAFGGEPFLPNLPPNHPKNVNRFKAYMEMVTAAHRIQTQAINQWLRINGLDPTNAEQWLQMAILAGGKVGAGAALAGQKDGVLAMLRNMYQQEESSLPGGLTETDLQLARHMTEKAKMYDLQLPAVIDADEDKVKKNGSKPH